MPTGKVREQQDAKQQMEQSQKASKADQDRMLKWIEQSAKNKTTRVDQTEQAKESHIARILDTPAEKANLAMFAKLVASMASSNIDLNAQNLSAKAASRMGRELDLLFQIKPDVSDIALMREPVAQKDPASVKTQQQKKNSEEAGKDLSASRETISIAKEYTAAYATCIVNASGEIKRKMERAEAELRQRGLSEKEIRSIQGSVKKSVRTDLSKAIKQAFLKKILTKGKSIETVIAAKNINDTLTLAASSKGAGSASFDGMRGLARMIAKEARAEAKGLVLERLELKLIEKILSGQTKELDNEVKSLVVLAIKLGVNMPQFITGWKKKKIDLGLFFLDPKLSAQLGMGGDPEEERESSYDMTEKEEKEILMNRLRALYMKRAIKHGIITRLDTAFKMRKLKNGLIKLGLKIDDFERVKKEGVAVARFKLLEMLKEVLAEKATLYDLAGPAFKLIERRIKGIMSNLDRIGEALVISEFENMRDTANRKMYDMAVQELHAVDAMLKSKSKPALEKKRGNLVKLIARLKEESKIEGIDIDPRSEELIKHGIEGLKIIQERA